MTHTHSDHSHSRERERHIHLLNSIVYRGLSDIRKQISCLPIQNFVLSWSVKQDLQEDTGCKDTETTDKKDGDPCQLGSRKTCGQHCISEDRADVVEMVLQSQLAGGTSYCLLQGAESYQRVEFSQEPVGLRVAAEESVAVLRDSLNSHLTVSHP